jgi:hypothetical protein
MFSIPDLVLDVGTLDFLPERSRTGDEPGFFSQKFVDGFQISTCRSDGRESEQLLAMA